MSWPWYDPSPKEAEEAYGYYRYKYSLAAQDYNTYQNRVQNLSYQKSTINKQISNYSSQKVNLEKRLEGIERIIGMMTGSSASGISVPDAISKASAMLNQTAESFKRSIVLVGGVAAADLAATFAIPSVENEIHSSTALQQYQAEKNWLEQEIVTIRRTIASLSESLSSITRSLNSDYDSQIAARNAMNSFAYKMNHYNRHRFR